MTQAQPSRPPLWRAALALILACPVAALAQGIPVRTLPTDEVLARAGLKLAWHTQVQILRTREQVASILVFEGKTKDAAGQAVRDAAVFVSTTHGQVHCFDADT